MKINFVKSNFIIIIVFILIIAVGTGTKAATYENKFEYESWHRAYEETGTEDYAKFTDEWIANKAPEVIEMDLSQKTLRGISLEDYTEYCTGRHILITRSKNKS